MAGKQYDNRFDLEEELCNLCEKENLDLHKRLDRIKKSAEEIWSNPRLYWFTDHGIGHSKRIIQILGYLLSHLQFNSKSPLSCSELYILLSACYLHDIGMQYLSNSSKGAEEFTETEFEKIRIQHPAKAEDLIVGRAIQHERNNFRIDLDDEPDYFIPIAQICKAHGSKFFDETITELSQSTYQPGGSPFRGVLLACLLMLADELDLHQSRAKRPNDVTLSPISALHYHVHSYVTGVKINTGETEKNRQVQIEMVFPLNSEKYNNFIIRWLSGKLTKQIRRTSKLIFAETNGELLISEKLIFHSQTSRYKQEPEQLPIESMNILIKEVSEFEMVNQDKPREIYSQMLKTPPEVRSLILISPDEMSEVESINWLKYQCKYKGIDCHITNFSGEPFNIDDLTYKLLHDVYEDAPVPSNIKNPLQVFIEKVNNLSQQKQMVIVFQNFNKIDDHLAVWVYKTLLKKIIALTASTAFVLTCTKQPDAFEDCSLFEERISWETISQETIEEVFLSYGFNNEDAKDKALELFTITRGKPENVILGLGLERKKWRTAR